MRARFGRLRHWRAWPWTDLIGSLATAALSSFGATLALRLWHMHLNVPLAYHSDTMLALMTVRNMQTTGSFQTSDLLNAPLGQSLLAYPSAAGDAWNMLGLRLLSLVLTPAATVNVFYLLGFPVIAVSAFLCLRVLRTSVPTAVALGAVYSWLPYRFLRSEYHLFLNDYAAVPLLCVAAVAVYRTGRDTRLRTLRWALALVAAFVLGGTGLYYAAFACVMWAGAAGLAAIARRTWRPLLAGAALCATTVLVLVVAAWPNLQYASAHGTQAVEGRGYLAAEFYGLKIANLLLPLSGHRIAAFSALRDATGNTAIPGEGTETLGVLGSVGFLVALVVLLLPVVRRHGELVPRLREIGALATAAVLVSTVAGFSGIAAAASFGLLRAWNRMSVVIAFLALAALAVLVDHLLAHSPTRARRWHPLVAWSLAAVISVVGLLDQTTDRFVPNYNDVTAGWQADADFYTRVQEMLGAGTAVFALPRADFPESPPVNVLDPYDLLAGYIHADSLKWSFGGVKGGDVEWQQAALADGVPAALPGLVAPGFRAILVHRVGYLDHGTAVEQQIRAVVGDVPTLVNRDGSVVVFDIRSYAEALVASGDLPGRQAVLTAPRLTYSSGFYGPESDATRTWQWATSPATARIDNPGTERKIVLVGHLRTADPRAAVTVTVGDQTFDLRAADNDLVFSLTVTVQPGATAVTLRTDSAATPSTPTDYRDLRQQVFALAVAPAG